MHLGELYESLGDPKSAEEAFRAALGRAATLDAETWALGAINRVAEARLALSADAVTMEKTRGRLALGRQLEDAGRLKDAESVYRQALSDAPFKLRGEVDSALVDVVKRQEALDQKYIHGFFETLPASFVYLLKVLLLLAIAICLRASVRAIASRRGRRKLAIGPVEDLSNDKVGGGFADVFAITLSRMREVAGAGALPLNTERLPILLPIGRTVGVEDVGPVVASGDAAKLLSFLLAAQIEPEFVVRATVRASAEQATMIVVLEQRGRLLHSREVYCPVGDCYDAQRVLAYEFLTKLSEAIRGNDRA